MAPAIPAIIAYAKTAATVLSYASMAKSAYDMVKGPGKTPGAPQQAKKGPTAPMTDETRSRMAGRRRAERMNVGGRDSTVLTSSALG